MRKTWIFLIIIFISASYVFGVFSVHNNISPYTDLKLIYKKITFVENEVDYTFDVESLIHINSVSDIQKIRTNLINFIWNDEGLPKNLPNNIEKISDNRYDNLENLKEIERIEVIMEYDVNSIAYLFVADNSIGELIIYHQGHSGDFVNGFETIQFFLDNGYSVLAFSMPLHGMNSQPIVKSEYFGEIHLTDHVYFRLLESEKFSPVKFFIEPIFVSLNYIEKNYSFSSYHFVGISGGGWTSVLYPAIDERISQTFSVAGSYPIFLRSASGLSSDYEQIVPEIYRIASYLDLYLIDSFGQDRKFIQIFNKFDPCCYSGTGYKSYELILEEKINSIQPADFEIFLDESHSEHKISDKTLQFILEELEHEKS